MALSGEPYDVGNTVTLFATMTDRKTGDPVDPTTVTFTVIKPGTHTEIALNTVKNGVGDYQADVVLDVPDRWYYWVRTQNPQSAKRQSFMVNS